ncbi:hypothetical protein Tco_1236490 [Tanacetum coccineum]
MLWLCFLALKLREYEMWSQLVYKKLEQLHVVDLEKKRDLKWIMALISNESKGKFLSAFEMGLCRVIAEILGGGGVWGVGERGLGFVVRRVYWIWGELSEGRGGWCGVFYSGRRDGEYRILMELVLKNSIEPENLKIGEKYDAPIIERCEVSDDEDDDEPNTKLGMQRCSGHTELGEIKGKLAYGQKLHQLGLEKNTLSGNILYKMDNDYYSKTSHPSAHKHMAPRAVLMKTGLKSINTARPVNTVFTG